jgi:hypothetical protein
MADIPCNEGQSKIFPTNDSDPQECPPNTAYLSTFYQTRSLAHIDENTLKINL